jgi:uncharacterized protein (DUF983 family)
MSVDLAPTDFAAMASDNALPRRPVLPAIGRGLRRRCPNCGRGKIMTRYLKVVANCPSCGEDLSHHRADDAPPYLTIVVVGHIIVPLILFVETRWHLPTTVHMAIWLPLTLLLSLVLLPSMKGAVVGLQWALRMHGFDRSDGLLPLPDGGFAEIVGSEDPKRPL